MSPAILTPEFSGEEKPAPSTERRALVIEDDPAIRILTTTILRREGFAVDAALNGREALTLISGCAYAIIVLDLMMPEMSGVELLEDLRERDAGMLRRVVVMTASVQRARPDLPDGVCHVLTKPFDLNEFLAAIASCASEVES